MFENYSGDEGFTLIVSAILALITWGYWLRDCLFVMRPWAKDTSRTSLLVAPMICAALLFAVLKLFAAGDVRDDPAYLLFPAGSSKLQGFQR